MPDLTKEEERAVLSSLDDKAYDEFKSLPESERKEFLRRHHTAKQTAAPKPQKRQPPQPAKQPGDIIGLNVPAPQEQPGDEVIGGIGNALSNMVTAVSNAPAVIGLGVTSNPIGVIGKAAANTAFPNAYQALREKRIFPGSLIGLGQDIAQLMFSPAKALRLGLKLQPIKKAAKLSGQINKTPSIATNAARNSISESINGAFDNVIYDFLSAAQDERERDISDFGISAATGGVIGGFSGPLQAREQAKRVKDYATWINPESHKQEVKQNIRNAQNETDSNLETFSKMVNEEHPFTTTAGLHRKKEREKNKAGKKIKEYEASPEGNAPIENATLSNFQEALENKLYADNSGNLGLEEKDFALEDFYKEARNVLVANSPRLKQHMENFSQAEFGDPRRYLKFPDFQDMVISGYNLSPSELNLLRGVFGRKTTLIIPNKSEHARAGTDNMNRKEYSEMFKKEIEHRPETKKINSLNKKYSKSENQEALAKEVLKKQGRGGILDYYFPFFDLNPELNPTVMGSTALKARNAANTLWNGGKSLSEVPQEDKEEYYKILEAMVEDALKLGIKTEDGIKKYLASRIQGDGPPAHKIVMESHQRKGEK